MSGPVVTAVWAEYRRDSVFIATRTPRLSWQATSSQVGDHPCAVEARLDGGEVRELPLSNTLVAWPFEPLADELPHSVDVRVRGAGGTWSSWSDPRTVRWADVASWHAAFIAAPAPIEPAQPALVRVEFDVPDDVIDATLHVGALGAVETRIDGRAVDDAVLTPGWTDYDSRVVIHSVDVTHLVRGAPHRQLEFSLTGAWYTEEYGFGPEGRRIYGEQPALTAELRLRRVDGSSLVLRSDESWLVSHDGPIVRSGLYAGETVDLRRNADDATWTPATTVPSQARVEAAIAEPVRRTEIVSPVSVRRAGDRRFLLDFGQNLVGRLRLHIDAPAGTTIVLRHAEVLDDDVLAVGPLRRAAATDTVVAGHTAHVFEPEGTFHGFRYAEVDGLDNLEPSDVVAVVLGSDLRRTGWFASSHPLIDRLHENVVWSARGNFLAIPTDCPQRDERMGWTGDAQIFIPAATTLFDCNGFFAHWLTDLTTEQERNGGIVPLVVPDVLRFPAAPTAAWGDAATIVPSVLAQRYADAELLDRQYASMRAWVDEVLSRLSPDGLWEGSIQLGDWLDPDAPPDQPAAAKCPGDLVATAYAFRSTSLLADAARRPDEAAHYRAAAERIRHAFTRAYVTPSGRMVSDSPTAYALALVFDLVSDAATRAALGARLAHVVRRAAYRISTGFIGTPIILDALTATEHTTEASRLLRESQYPSWLYPVTMGATTVWERWDSLLPDGTINPGEMTSFNHYAFGAVIDWMYRALGGLVPTSPGYSRVGFTPVFLAGLDHIDIAMETPSGRFESRWRRVAGDRIEIELHVPFHATADVTLPGLPAESVGSGTHRWSMSDPVDAVGSSASVSLGSSFRAILDDEQAYDAIVGALVDAAPDAASRLHQMADWTAEDPLARAFFALPPHAVGAVAGALSAVSQDREASRPS